MRLEARFDKWKQDMQRVLQENPYAKAIGKFVATWRAPGGHPPGSQVRPEPGGFLDLSRSGITWRDLEHRSQIFLSLVVSALYKMTHRSNLSILRHGVVHNRWRGCSGLYSA
jgi:hypothetical protein